MPVEVAKTYDLFNQSMKFDYMIVCESSTEGTLFKLFSSFTFGGSQRFKELD